MAMANQVREDERWGWSVQNVRATMTHPEHGRAHVVQHGLEGHHLIPLEAR